MLCLFPTHFFFVFVEYQLISWRLEETRPGPQGHAASELEAKPRSCNILGALGFLGSNNIVKKPFKRILRLYHVLQKRRTGQLRL